jgi:formylglycine-generating enzyme required for sulfatase activity
MKSKAFHLIFLLVFMFLSFNSYGNNITINNLNLASQNTVDDYYLVGFDVSWDNSWRISTGPSNWDAAWVFIKFLDPDNGLYKHATLNYVDGTAANDGHTAPGGCVLNATSDGKGVMVYRSADGSGTVNWSVELRWNYAVDGISDDDPITLKAFAIEMVYIPQGAFYVGDGNTFGGYYTLTYINTPDASTTPVNDVGGYPSNFTTPLNPNFPNGFNSFYIMKYEVSEGQWVSFFNTLSSNQKLYRDITGSPGKNTDNTSWRNTVSWLGTGSDATTSASDRACGWFQYQDHVAYLDWAALRPFSDMEFEKAARGPIPPVINEFAWGTANIHYLAYSITNDGTPGAVVSNPSTATTVGNASYNTTDGALNGPLRCGIFAATASGDRFHAGGSYYGVMELSGNLREPTVASDRFQSFTGAHGDGLLDTDGYGGAGLNWPGSHWNGKGGSFYDDYNAAKTSHIQYLAAFGRAYQIGIRGARTVN